MSDRHWHTHACRCDSQLGLVEDLARLVDDLDLLLVVAIGLESPSARHDVVRELIGIRCHRRLLAVGDRLRLLLQLIDQRTSGARRRLIGGDQHALQAGRLLQRVQGDGQRDRAAVRIGDDALVLADVVAVHLGHHQRHVFLHPPRRAVVDHQCAGFRRDRAIHQRDVAASGEQGDVDALERGLAKLFHLERAAVVRHGHALGPLGREGDDAFDRKLPLREDAQHLVADHPGRAYDSNV